MWGAIISGGLGLLGMAKGMSNARKVKKQAGINADFVIEETEEELRRMRRDVKTSEGMAAAVSAASGIAMSGSRQLSVQDIKKENQAQLAWLDKAGKQKAQAVRAGGQLQASQLRTQAVMQGISGITQLAGSGLFSSSKPSIKGG